MKYNHSLRRWDCPESKLGRERRLGCGYILKMGGVGMKKILWNRKLSCGHERQTNVAFECTEDGGKKPLEGDDCYCRECFAYVKIVEY